MNTRTGNPITPFGRVRWFLVTDRSFYTFNDYIRGGLGEKRRIYDTE